MDGELQAQLEPCQASNLISLKYVNVIAADLNVSSALAPLLY